MLAVDERLDRLTHCLVAAQEGAEGQRPEPCDVTILQSLPGVGRIVLATLLAEAFEAVQRRDYRALRCLAGVAPVTKRSGKSRIVLLRQAAHVLRNAVYHIGVACAMLEAKTIFDPNLASQKALNLRKPTC